jgi:hypothetical protein
MKKAEVIHSIDYSFIGTDVTEVASVDQQNNTYLDGLSNSQNLFTFSKEPSKFSGELDAFVKGMQRFLDKLLFTCKSVFYEYILLVIYMFSA